ncbi:MAG TPA: FecR domain-containing protein [Candidatus Acidoferrum sp.]|nr:FecR domain-containing protein [Candidatus Acidoferrum sp.]
MKVFWRRVAALLAFGVSVNPPATFGQSAPANPEIVRLTYVEGDVRLSSGGGKKGAVGQTWVQAQAGIPIEEGFNLATGTGRAEIEFETGSVVFLADNSTLSFCQLSVVNSVPATCVELLSGTATINVHPVKDETFKLETPNLNAVTVAYPNYSFLRIESFLDGMKVTLQEDTLATHEGKDKVQLAAGQTLTYVGPNIVNITAPSAAAPDEWDTWVKARLSTRKATMDAALKASGLSEPVPGLADLYQSGSFFPCAPYGTCWQPNESMQASPESSGENMPQGSQQTSSQSSAPTPVKQPQAGKPRQIVVTEARFEPCVTTTIIRVWDPRKKVWVEHTFTENNSIEYSGSLYWNWALCRAGTWIYRNPNYLLVLRKKKHHHRPVRWVRVGNKTGFVPTSPKDEKGKPPVNLKHGLFVPTGKASEPIERVAVDPSKEVKLLAEGPKDFREFTSYMPPAERPEITQQFLDVKSAAAAGVVAKDGQLKIAYDYKRQGFVESRVAAGGHTSKPVLVATLSPRGIVAGNAGGNSSRSGGSGSRIEYGGARSSGGYSGGSGRGGGYSGGGSSGRTGGGSYTGGGYSGGGYSGGSAGGSSGGGSSGGSRAK